MYLDTINISELERFFNDLKLVDQRKIFAAGFRKAANPLKNKMQALVPVKTGNLRRSIGSSIARDEIALYVGTKIGGANDGWYGHFLEEGTKDRYRKDGSETGKIKGKHFASLAFMYTEDEVYSNIEQEWYKAIDRFIVRTNKKLK